MYLNFLYQINRLNFNSCLDLDKLGGLIAVIQGLYDSHSNIRITSAWIIGKACQNNPLVQNQVIFFISFIRIQLQDRSEV